VVVAAERLREFFFSSFRERRGARGKKRQNAIETEKPSFQSLFVLAFRFTFRYSIAEYSSKKCLVAL
jgi:hypothetical protein